MNAPLQQAHEAAVEEEKPAVICTVAGPRLPFSSEVYNGAELRASSHRPGAYTAFALPSLFNGKKHVPGTPALAAGFVHTSGRTDFIEAMRTKIARIDAYNAAHSDAVSLSRAIAKAIKPVREPKPPRVPKPPRPPAPPRVKAPYLPRDGSIPSLLMSHLHANGGHITYAEVCSRYGLPVSSTTAVFKKALRVGVVVRVVVDGRAALALPGYVPPPATPRPSKEVLLRQARLEKRLAQVAQLQRELRELQAKTTPAAEITS